MALILLGVVAELAFYVLLPLSFVFLIDRAIVPRDRGLLTLVLAGLGALLGRGELFGDIAFFTRAGERTASVRAVTDGRILVLRRKFLQELNRSEPEAVFQILTNMSRIMAERLVRAEVRTVADGES